MSESNKLVELVAELRAMQATLKHEKEYRANKERSFSKRLKMARRTLNKLSRVFKDRFGTVIAYMNSVDKEECAALLAEIERHLCDMSTYEFTSSKVKREIKQINLAALKQLKSVWNSPERELLSI